MDSVAQDGVGRGEVNSGELGEVAMADRFAKAKLFRIMFGRRQT